MIAFSGTHQLDLTTSADDVLNLVTLSQLQGATHGFRHRGLVAVG